jgi:two-component system LytT family response regulator
MLRALIVDDEAPARFELRSLLEETGQVDAISEASNAREAVASLVKSREHAGEGIDVIFLDVSMPKTSGMQLADALHKLRNPPLIVFVTAYSEYALEAFGVDAVDYLMKPVDIDRLRQTLTKIEMRLKATAPVAHPSSSTERIPVEKGGHKVLVPISQIHYVEAKDDYSCIYTADDRFLSTISLAKLEQRLTPHGFYRVHRGYIVNLAYVQDFTTVAGGVLQLGLKDVEDKKIPVSRRRVVAVKRMLGL